MSEEHDPLENDVDFSIPQLDLDDAGVEPGVRRLAAAIILDAVQAEKAGGGDTRNRDFLAGHGWFNFWSRCIGYNPEFLHKKIEKALYGFTRGPRSHDL